METFFTWAIGLGSLSLAVLIVLRIRMIFTWISEVVRDTCKGKDGRWSLSSIMMIMSFDSALVIIFYDTFKQGKLNEFAVITLLAVATTGKIFSAQAKKIDPTVVAPATETSKENELKES